MNPFKTAAMHDAPAVPNQRQPTTSVEYFREIGYAEAQQQQPTITSSSAITM